MSYVLGDDAWSLIIPDKSDEGTVINSMKTNWMLEDGRDAMKIGYITKYEPEVDPEQYGGKAYNIKTSSQLYVGKHRTVIRGCKYNRMTEIYIPIDILSPVGIEAGVKENGAICYFEPTPTDCGTGKCCGTATKNRKIPDNVASVNPVNMCGGKDETWLNFTLTEVDSIHDKVGKATYMF